MRHFTVEIRNISAPTTRIAVGQTFTQSVEATDKSAAKSKVLRALFDLCASQLDQRMGDGAEYCTLLSDRDGSGTQSTYGKVYVYVKETEK